MPLHAAVVAKLEQLELAQHRPVGEMSLRAPDTAEHQAAAVVLATLEQRSTLDVSGFHRLA